MARPFRFTFILVLAALATGLAAVGGWRFARASAPVNGPIILISIDTLRADHLPAYGYRKVKTPAIDALAADGTVFERAYSHAPQTLPAHASILSGRLPFETGVRDNAGFVVKPGERMLPQMLRDRGYSTAGVVSSYVLRRETGIGQGFEFFDSEMPQAATGASIGQLQRDGGESETVAERWLNLQRSPRVFLFLHLYEPHKPYASPEHYAEYSPYDGEIAYADELVGRLIQNLKSHQLYDRSTIVLLSDHGEGLGDHGEQEHGLLLYEEAIHVPLIIKQAGGTGAGRRITDLVQHIDVAPTILDLAKAPIPGNLRGRSLKALLEGGRPLQPVSVYSEAMYGRYHFGWSALTAATEDRYHYVKAPREELYDLEHDPREKVDVGPQRAQARLALRTALDRMTAGAAIQPAGQISEQDRERLNALGYVGAHTDSPAGPDDDPAIDPKDSIAILEAYRRAAELVANDRLIPAVDILQRLAHDHPSMPQAWQELGRVLVVAGQLEQAARAFQRAAALTPRDASALVAAANVFYRLGRLDEAQHEAESALMVTADVPGRSPVAAEEALARIAIARKDVEGAREHAAAAQRADPSAPHVTFVDGLIAYNQGHYEEALPLLVSAAAAKRNRIFPLADLHFYTAEALRHLERWDEAIAEFNAEIALFPRNLKARASLALACVAAGRREDGEQALSDLITVARTPEGYGIAARAWTMLGEPRRAQALKAEARRVFRGDPSLRLIAQIR